MHRFCHAMRAIPFLLCLLLGLPTTSAHAATFTVTKLADATDGVCNADCSLREAIVAANNAVGTDVIAFASGVTGNLDLATALPSLTGSTNVQGPGAGTLTVRRSTVVGTPKFRIFDVQNGVTASISGLTISNGFVGGTAFGGGINNDGTLTLTACIISGNTATGSSGPGAGANGSDGQGGGIYNSGTLTLNNCVLNGNTARGGAGNTTGNGGVAQGGGIFSKDGTLTLIDSSFDSNSATGGNGTNGGVAQGGAIRSENNATVTGCTFSSNSATGGTKADGQGGGIYNSGTLSLSGSTLTNNTANGINGGVGQGGGIRNSAALTLTNSTLQGNVANGGDSSGQGGAGVGGGIYNSGGTIGITGSTLNSNSATGGDSGAVQGGAGLGGGIYNNNASTLTLTNSTLSGNSTQGGASSGAAGGASLGGGLFMQSGGTGGTATLSSTTVAGNSAGDAGGILVAGGNLTLNNSLVALNTGSTSPDIRGALNTASQYNLIGNGNIMTGVTNGTNGNKVGTDAAPIDPKLGPLQNNGGLTKTRALLPGSPALDQGKNFGVTTDQRGQLRPINDASIPNASGGDGSDIGAFEAQSIQISISNPRAIPEGSAATPGSTIFVITLSAPSAQTVTVNYQTANGVTNGAIAGSDYVAKSGTLTFAPGETVKRVTVNFIGDAVAELNEPFFLDLKTPTNATLAVSRGSAYIKNDDGPSLAIASATAVFEGNSGTTPQTFVVTLSAASTNTITVDWATANNTAGPTDYVAASGTLTFAPGETSKNIVVQVRGDTLVEQTETYRVNIKNPTFAVVVDSQGVGYIKNDDTTPAIAFEEEPSQ